MGRSAGMVRGLAAVSLAFLLLVSGSGTEAFAGGKGWRDLPPKLMLEDRPSWRNFEPSGGSGGGASAAGSWNEAMTLMPGLDIPEGVVKFVPTIPFVQTLMSDEELASMPKEVPIELPELLAEPIPDDFRPLSQGDKEMVDEGQKLWEDMVGLREKLLVEPTLLVTEEGEKVVDEFHRMQESFEKIRVELQERQQQAHPVVRELMGHFEKAFAPLGKMIDEQKGNAIVKIFSIVAGPLFGAALRKVQLLSGALALAEVIHVTSKIKETSANDVGGMRKASLHMQRADTGIVSAAAILDRIMNDIQARRPVDKADLQLFRSEQHDISVQLANVRSQIDKARGGAVSETRRRAGKAKRWVAAAGTLAAFSHVAGVLTGGVGVAATAVVASAGAANAFHAGAQGDIVKQVESMQMRHDDAVSEHVSLQAQFQEAVRGLGDDNRTEQMHAGNADQRIRELRKLGPDALGPGAAGSWIPAELQQNPAKVEEDSSGGGLSSVGGGGAQERETARQAVLDVLRDLVRSANQNDPKSPSKAETTIDRLKAQSTARLASATSQRPTGLKAPSTIRHPTVSPAPQGPLPLPRKLGSPRASGLRAPSVFSGPSIQDARRTASLSASPAPGDGLAGPGSSRMSPRSRERRSAARRTPGALSQQVSLSDNHAGKKLEEQLLELLDARIQVAGDDEKRQGLEALWQSLRQATRAARQQVRACERTEAVLSDCVDPEMRSKIMDAQQEATLRTQEAMRVCLRETMVSLEAEYRIKEERDSKAGLAKDTAMADGIAEKLIEARKALEEQEERLRNEGRQRESSVAPQRAVSVGAAPQEHNSSSTLSGVQEPRRSKSSGSKGERSATWQQFLKRQEAASARNQARRAASMEPSKTPGAESVAPVSRAPSESLGNATEVDQSKSKDEDESKDESKGQSKGKVKGAGKEQWDDNDDEGSSRGGNKESEKSENGREGRKAGKERDRGGTKGEKVASPDSSLA